MWLGNDTKLQKAPVLFSLHSTEAKSLQKTVPIHPEMEIIYVHEGMGQVVLNGGMHEIKKGTLIIIRPFERYQLRLHPSHPYIRSLMIVDPVMLELHLQTFKKLRQFFLGLWKDRTYPQVVQISQMKELEEYLEKISRRFPFTPLQRDMEQSMLSLIHVLDTIRPCVEYGGGRGPHACRPPAVSDPVEGMLRWIEEHYHEKFELARLSRDAHLSATYASALFRKETGKNLGTFIAERRMNQACRLLEGSDCSIKEVGMRVGYSNFSHFCKIFKRIIGCPPQAYRRSLK